jgi:hypothetical protein
VLLANALDEDHFHAELVQVAQALEQSSSNGACTGNDS